MEIFNRTAVGKFLREQCDENFYVLKSEDYKIPDNLLQLRAETVLHDYKLNFLIL